MIDFSAIKLRPATESDREFSYAVKRAAEGKYITELFEWDEAVQVEFHRRAWQDEKPDLIVYKGTRIGTIATTETDDSVEIAQFFILPEFENQGIGTFLLRQILERADRANKVARLAYLKNNPAASLYLRQGFEVVRFGDPFYYAERRRRTER